MGAELAVVRNPLPREGTRAPVVLLPKFPVRQSSPIRILIINKYARVTGGADIHCLEISKGLRERGHEVSWLSTAGPNNVEFEGQFIPFLVGSENRDQVGLARKLKAASWALWNPEASRRTIELLEGFQPDVVHVHKSYVQLSVSPVVEASRRGIPIVQTVHDYEFISANAFDSSGSRFDTTETKLSYQMLNSMAFAIKSTIHRPRVDHWIAVSQAVANIYQANRGIHCTVIPNFAEPSTETPPPQSDRYGVLFLGRLSREKGIDDALEVASMNPDTPFTFAGDGPLRSKVLEAVENSENVFYQGFVQGRDGRNLLRSARICLMPSRWDEPGPLVSLEAMAEGTPVICYPNGGLAEYVSTARAGLVTHDADPQQLSEAINTLDNDPCEWSRLSENGIDAIAASHSREKYLDALEALYCTVSASQK